MRLTAQQKAVKREKKTVRRERVASREAERAARPVEVHVSPYEGLAFHECRVSRTLFEDGIGHVVVSRWVRKDRLVLAGLLIDTWCLGVKNAFIRPMSLADYEAWDWGRVPLRTVTPEYACKLVFEAEAYAAAHGMSAHPDFARARDIFAGVDAGGCAETFRFGRDGKPLYVAGPHDTPGRQATVLSALQQAQGEAFDYLLPVAGMEALASVGR